MWWWHVMTTSVSHILSLYAHLLHSCRPILVCHISLAYSCSLCQAPPGTLGRVPRTPNYPPPDGLVIYTTSLTRVPLTTIWVPVPLLAHALPQLIQFRSQIIGRWISWALSFWTNEGRRDCCGRLFPSLASSGSAAIGDIQGKQGMRNLNGIEADIR
ncbi:hypothetical protein BJV77DRAFT_55127 [Russula vinacea]|nr:hypothetical protein BJV77DRAFT_55127 [Russula vinacea]